ncbi:MAG: hypothetical protein E3J43_09890 [Candidatus Heimdallarchaeota archaeon]|nr:MAG: hypothetical protein E3J43_09890 [Candidatus Heimdallarchaeota archaeon]
MKKVNFLLFVLLFVFPIITNSNDSYNLLSNSLDDQLPETIIAITQIITYPEIVYVGQLVFVNCTVENRGQFKTAELVNLKVNATVNLGEKELTLEGSIEPGQYETANFNLTTISAGVGNITITVSTENAQTVSKSVLIDILEENISTTNYAFHAALLIFPLAIFVISKQAKQRKRKKG